MTKIKTVLCVAILSGCAGGNAIERGVPANALAGNAPTAQALTPFPPPAQPDAALQASSSIPANAPVSPQAGTLPPVTAPIPTGAQVTAPPPAPALTSTTVTPPPIPTGPTPPRPPLPTPGLFPDIGNEPVARLNPADLARNRAMAAQLDALRRQQESGQISTATYQQRLAELQRLAASHSSETLQRIQSQ